MKWRRGKKHLHFQCLYLMTSLKIHFHRILVQGHSELQLTLIQICTEGLLISFRSTHMDMSQSWVRVNFCNIRGKLLHLSSGRWRRGRVFLLPGWVSPTLKKAPLLTIIKYPNTWAWCLWGIHPRIYSLLVGSLLLRKLLLTKVFKVYFLF